MGNEGKDYPWCVFPAEFKWYRSFSLDGDVGSVDGRLFVAWLES